MSFNHVDDFDSQCYSQQNSNKARKKAEQYPQKWSEFEYWFENISRDFMSAEFDSWSVPYSVPLPTTGKSITGWVFIIAGVGTGVFIAVCNMQFLNIESRSVMFKVLGMIFPALGGWIGVLVHAYFNFLINGKGEDGPPVG